MKLKFILIVSVDLERLFEKLERLTERIWGLSKRVTKYLAYLVTLFDRYLYLLHLYKAI